MITEVVSLISAWWVTYFLLGVFASVAYTIHDIVKIMVLGVIGYRCSLCQITIPEVAISTVGIEDMSLRIQ